MKRRVIQIPKGLNKEGFQSLVYSIGELPKLKLSDTEYFELCETYREYIVGAMLKYPKFFRKMAAASRRYEESLFELLYTDEMLALFARYPINVTLYDIDTWETFTRAQLYEMTIRHKCYLGVLSSLCQNITGKMRNNLLRKYPQCKELIVNIPITDEYPTAEQQIVNNVKVGKLAITQIQSMQLGSAATADLWQSYGKKIEEQIHFQNLTGDDWFKLLTSKQDMDLLKHAKLWHIGHILTLSQFLILLDTYPTLKDTDIVYV